MKTESEEVAVRTALNPHNITDNNNAIDNTDVVSTTPTVDVQVSHATTTPATTAVDGGGVTPSEHRQSTATMDVDVTSETFAQTNQQGQLLEADNMLTNTSSPSASSHQTNNNVEDDVDMVTNTTATTSADEVDSILPDVEGSLQQHQKSPTTTTTAASSSADDQTDLQQESTHVEMDSSAAAQQTEQAEETAEHAEEEEEGGGGTVDNQQTPVAEPNGTVSGGVMVDGGQSEADLQTQMVNQLLVHLCPGTSIIQPPARLSLPLPRDGFMCDQCGDRFVLPSSLAQHMARRVMDIFYSCGDCQRVVLLSNKCQLLEHLDGHKTDVESLDPALVEVTPLSMSELCAPSKMFPTADNNLHIGPPQLTKMASVSSLNKVNKPVFVSCPMCNIRCSSSTLASHLCPDTGSPPADPSSQQNSEPVSGGSDSLDIVPPRCPDCAQPCPSQCALIAHQGLHKPNLWPYPYVCPECGLKVLGSFDEYRRHVIGTCLHTARDLKSCCAVCLIEVGDITSHMVQTHVQTLYKCRRCPLAFESLHGFNSHVKAKHDGQLMMMSGGGGGADSPYMTIVKCPFCSATFGGAKTLREHMAGKRHGSRVLKLVRFVFRCAECGVDYGRKELLADHLAREHPDYVPVLPAVTSLTNATADGDEHIANSSAGGVGGGFDGSLADVSPSAAAASAASARGAGGGATRGRGRGRGAARLSSASSAASSVAVRHSGRVSSASMASSPSSASGSGTRSSRGGQATSASAAAGCLVCAVCDEPCGSRSAYVMHARQHLEQGVPLCLLCNLGFDDEDALKVHIAEHACEIGRDRCGLCYAKLGSRDALQAHLENEHNMRNFSCPKCGELFERLAALNRHNYSRHSGGRPGRPPKRSSTASSSSGGGYGGGGSAMSASKIKMSLVAKTAAIRQQDEDEDDLPLSTAQARGGSLDTTASAQAPATKIRRGTLPNVMSLYELDDSFLTANTPTMTAVSPSAAAVAATSATSADAHAQPPPAPRFVSRRGRPRGGNSAAAARAAAAALRLKRDVEGPPRLSRGAGGGGAVAVVATATDGSALPSSAAGAAINANVDEEMDEFVEQPAPPQPSSGHRCVHCQLESGERAAFVAHVRQHRLAGQHQCVECGQCYWSGASLRKHLLLVHKLRALPSETIVPPPTAAVINATTSSAAAARKQRGSAAASSSALIESEAERWRRLVSGDVAAGECPVCGLHLVSDAVLQQHLKTHGAHHLRAHLAEYQRQRAKQQEQQQQHQQQQRKRRSLTSGSVGRGETLEEIAEFVAGDGVTAASAGGGDDVMSATMVLDAADEEDEEDDEGGEEVIELEMKEGQITQKQLRRRRRHRESSDEEQDELPPTDASVATHAAAAAATNGQSEVNIMLHSEAN